MIFNCFISYFDNIQREFHCGIFVCSFEKSLSAPGALVVHLSLVSCSLDDLCARHPLPCGPRPAVPILYSKVNWETALVKAVVSSRLRERTGRATGTHLGDDSFWVLLLALGPMVHSWPVAGVNYHNYSLLLPLFHFPLLPLISCFCHFNTILQHTV